MLKMLLLNYNMATGTCINCSWHLLANFSKNLKMSEYMHHLSLDALLSRGVLIDSF